MRRWDGFAVRQRAVRRDGDTVQPSDLLTGVAACLCCAIALPVKTALWSTSDPEFCAAEIAPLRVSHAADKALGLRP